MSISRAKGLKYLPVQQDCLTLKVIVSIGCSTLEEFAIQNPSDIFENYFYKIHYKIILSMVSGSR
jgi:hypothetical protein